MKVAKFIPHAIFATLGLGFTYGVYTMFFAKKEERLYSTKKPEVRNIKKIIRATGGIQPVDLMKIGSIIIGVIDEMFVEENEFVKKGQLLATIDDGKGDTNVRAAQASLDQAKAHLTYYTAFFKRQQALHESHFISDDDFEKYSAEYEQAKKEVDLQKAQYDQAKMLFDKKQITAPDDGIVVGKTSSEGETVTFYAPATIIYTIAKDIKKMKAEIEIDESTVSFVKKGMEADLTFDTYLGRIFKSKITDISNNPIEKGGAICYKGTLPIDNNEMLFKPGMTITAEIIVAEKKHVLAVRGQQFAIKPETIEKVAKIKKMGYHPLSLEERAKHQKHGETRVVWIERDNAFIEQPIKIGLTDGAFFEIIDGITDQDLVVEDTIEENAMEKAFGKIFGSGLK